MPAIDNGRDWIRSLGDVPLERILFQPWPGTATEKDVLRHVEGNPKKLVELVNGTLVEKALGHFESRLALRLVIHLGAFVEEHDLGELVGADGTTRMSDGNVRMPDVGFIVK
ncbi:MAG: Uma2 family endonuclease, partial [Planctomycetota bacterium]